MNVRVYQTVLVVCLAASTCAAGPVSLDVDQPEEEWEVTRVIDGDTIKITGLGTVRLLGIDAPESVHPRLSVQPCGLDAAVYMHQLTYRRRVRIEVSPGSSRDRYGRILAVVWKRVGDTYIDINRRMVRQGFAKVETRWYFSYREEYLMEQKQAQRYKRGIWGEKCK